MKVKNGLLWFFGIMVFLTGFFGLFTISWTGIFLMAAGLLLIPAFKRKLNFETKYQVIACVLSFVLFGAISPSTNTKIDTVVTLSSQSESSASSSENLPITSASSSIEESASAANQASTLSQESSIAAKVVQLSVPTSITSDLKVHFIDVGQADCILVQLPNSQTMLIDGGNEPDSELILNYLSIANIKTIDYLVATHPHEDHIGGLPAVINALDIKSIYMPKASSTTQIFEKLLTAIQNKGLSVNTAKSGVNILSIPGLQMDIVAAVGDSYEDLNDYSAVIKLTYKNNSFLFTGDAETVSEDQITADVKSNVLKVGHHGSDSSTTAAFLKKVDPQYAIISVGKDNSYGHPNDETLARLNDAGIKIFRTDELGTIVFTSDGNSIKVDKEPTPYSPNAPPVSSTIESSSSTQSIEQPPASSQTQSVTVYVTNTGEKYHSGGCRYLKKSKIAISLEDAKRSYGACSVCNPPR